MLISVGYNFLGDYFFFSLNLTWLQTVGVVVCMASCVAAAIFKVCEKEYEPDHQKK